MLLGKKTIDSRPYELSLTSKYMYTLERARMGKFANVNSLVKAFSHLEITSYKDSISHRRLNLHRSGDVTFGVEVLNHQI